MTGSERLDLYDLEGLYTDEERLVRDTVRAFVRSQVQPVVTRHWERGTFPTELVAELGELGVFGATLPDHGCAGVSDVAYGLILQELEKGDSGLRSFVSVQSSLVMYPIHAFGSKEQKERWLPRLRTGEVIGCYGLTEPNHGTDPGGMRTRAWRDGDSWVLHGSKMWITNGSCADVAVVWARTDEGIRGFLVEQGTPGFTSRKTEHKWALRMSDTSELLFDECRIPGANLLPGAAGLRSPLMCLNQARYGIAWGAVGAAEACLLEGLRYAGEREQFGAPIASYQLVQERLAEFASQLTLGQLMVHRLGRLKEEGRASGVQISMAKRWTVRMALDCARAVRDLHGAAGIVLDHAVGRHMCNLEAVSTYEGTHNAHTLILGEHLTGIPAFRGAGERSAAGETAPAPEEAGARSDEETVPNGDPVPATP